MLLSTLQVAGEVRQMVLNEQTAELRALIEAFGEQPPQEATVAWLGLSVLVLSLLWRGGRGREGGEGEEGG